MSPRRARPTVPAALWVLASSIGSAAHAQGGGFHLNRPRAALDIKAEHDTVRQRNSNQSTYWKEQLFQQRLKMDFDGDIYDERFLRFRVQAGAAVSQDKVVGDGRRFSRARELEYGGRLQLLPEHAVSSAWFADRRESSVHNTYAGRTRVDSQNLRGSVSLKERFPMTLSAWNSRVTGDGFGRPFDQDLRGAAWEGLLSRSDGDLSLALNQKVEKFRDGSVANDENRVSEAFLDWRPGEKHQVSSRANKTHRRGALTLDSTDLNARWEYRRPRLNGAAEFAYEQRSLDVQDTTRKSGSARIEHELFESLRSSARFDASITDEARDQSTARRAEIQETYTKSLWGPLKLQADMRAHMQWKQSRFSALLAAAVDERFVLTDGALAYLENLGLVPGSLSIISDDRQRRYVEGTDYTLVAHGELTEVRRVPTGTIVNGDALLATYRYRIEGNRATEDTGRAGRAGLLLGTRGRIMATESRQDQTVAYASKPSLIQNFEAFRESSLDIDLTWKFLSCAQTWRNRRSTIAPVRTYRSNLKVGGEVYEELSLILGWTYDGTHFPSSGTSVIGRDYFLEGIFRPTFDVESKVEARTGSTMNAGQSNRYGLLSGTVAWSFRQVTILLGDRFTKRWVADTYAEENFLNLTVTRTF